MLISVSTVSNGIGISQCTECPVGLLTQDDGANDVELCIPPPETIPVWDENLRIPVWVYLEIPLASVTEEVKWTVRRGVAKSCDVTVDRVRIISVNAIIVRRRRLLSEVVQIDTEVAALDDFDEAEIRIKLNTTSVAAEVMKFNALLPVTDVLLFPALRCPTGWQQNSVECIACTAGYYMTGTNNTRKCNKCPIGSTSAMNAVGFSSCYSDCPVNLYWDALLIKCVPCPSFSSSSAGVTGIQNCKCSSGHLFRSNNCDTCTANYAKSPTGTGDCTPCPANSISAVGATNRDIDCVCKRNYYNDVTAPTEDSRCKPCPRGYAKGPSNAAECKQSNSASLSTLDGVELQLNGAMAIVFVVLFVCFVFGFIRMCLHCCSSTSVKHHESGFHLCLGCLRYDDTTEEIVLHTI